MIAIPRELEQRPIWFTWRKLPADPKTGKFGKLPTDPATGAPIDNTDPATWHPFCDVARKPLRGTALGNGISGIDLDNCYNVNETTGELEAAIWAQAIIKQANSYTEVSPSGKGVKIWVIGTLPDGLASVVSKAGALPDGGAIEVYSHDRFFTFTGQHLDGTPMDVQPAQGLLNDLAKRYHQPKPKRGAAARPILIAIDDDLKALRLRGRELATRLAAGRLDPVTYTALRNELYKDVNERIKALVPTRYNDQYTCQQVLEMAGATLMRSNSTFDYYSALPGDPHGNTRTAKYRVDRLSGRGFGMSPNGRPGNDTNGHNAFSFYTVLFHNGDTKAAQAAAADILAPIGDVSAITRISTETPAPKDDGATATQREAWRRAKVEQRAAQKAKAIAIRNASIERANADPRLFGPDGHGTIVFVTLLALLDFMGQKTWCRPSVATLANHIGCSERNVQRGLADLEHKYCYITTARNVNPETGELWSGGRRINTPIRTLVDYTQDTKKTSPEPVVCSIATPQSDETGMTHETVYVTHDNNNTHNHVLSQSNRQAGGQEQTAAPEPQLVAPSFDLDRWERRQRQRRRAETSGESLVKLERSISAPRLVEDDAPEQVTIDLRQRTAEDDELLAVMTGDYTPPVEQISLLDQPQPIQRHSTSQERPRASSVPPTVETVHPPRLLITSAGSDTQALHVDMAAEPPLERLHTPRTSAQLFGSVIAKSRALSERKQREAAHV